MTDFVCTDTGCGPVCDFCQWYRFNGNEVGAYVGEGECVHPAHPHKEEPFGGCDDYLCTGWPSADAEQVAAHHASTRAVLDT